MVKKVRYSDLYRAKLMNLETGETFSANAGDYWSMDKSKKFGKNFALVVERPVSGKDVVGGHKLMVLKKNPSAGDLVDQICPENKSRQISKRKLRGVC